MHLSTDLEREWAPAKRLPAAQVVRLSREDDEEGLEHYMCSYNTQVEHATLLSMSPVSAIGGACSNVQHACGHGVRP